MNSIKHIGRILAIAEVMQEEIENHNKSLPNGVPLLNSRVPRLLKEIHSVEEKYYAIRDRLKDQQASLRIIRDLCGNMAKHVVTDDEAYEMAQGNLLTFAKLIGDQNPQT